MAAARHIAGDSYGAVVQGISEKFVVDVASDWISVLFFDANSGLYMKYDFKKVDPGRLFLSAAMHIEFAGEIHPPHRAVTFAFKMDGSIVIERRNMLTGVVEEKSSHGDCAANWEAYPEFGDYYSVCRSNREPKK